MALAEYLLQDFIEGDYMRVVNHYSSAEDAMSRIPNLPLPDVILKRIRRINGGPVSSTFRQDQFRPQHL